MESGSYRERTIQNVIDSDATLIICFGEPEGGTLTTVLQCEAQKKPYKLIDASAIPPGDAALLAAAFIAEHSVSTLNVAGPRASKIESAYQYAFDVVTRLLGQR